MNFYMTKWRDLQEFVQSSVRCEHTLHSEKSVRTGLSQKTGRHSGLLEQCQQRYDQHLYPKLLSKILVHGD